MKTLRNVGRISWSQISSYQWCPKQWALHYLEKKWPAKKAQPQCFGIAYHAAIELFLHRYGVLPGLIPEEIEEMEIIVNDMCSKFDYEYTFGRNAGSDPDTWLPIGNQLLRTFAVSLFDREFEPLEIESWYENSLLKGKIDCIGMVDGQKLLIDWKTANKGYSQEKVDNDGQLTVYQWLYPKEVDGVAFVVANKETGEVNWHKSTRTQEQIEQVEKQVRFIQTEMNTLEKFQGVHNYRCQWCDLTPYHCSGEGDW